MSYPLIELIGGLVAVCVFAGCSKENNVDASTQCGDNTLECVPCSPGEYRCDGATLRQCRPDGQGFSGVSKCASEALCVLGQPDGVCAAPVCNISDTKCDGAKMWICPPEQDKLVSTDCPSADSCQAGLKDGKCGVGDCYPCCMYPGADCGAGKKCAIEDKTQGTTKCVTAGTKGPYEPCVQDGECQAGLFCEMGTCHSTCTTADHCSGIGTRCREVYYDAGNGTLKQIPKLSVCEKDCSPVPPQTGCPAGAACYIAAAIDYGDGVSCGWVTDCIGTGTGKTTPNSCSKVDPETCAAGYGCTVALPFLCGMDYNFCTKDATCTKWCDRKHDNANGTANTDCPSGWICSPADCFNGPSGQRLGMCGPG